MSAWFADRLDAALARLRAASCTSIVLTADAAALELMFRERGDQAILFDADRTRDIAWYAGDCEIQAGAAPVPMLSYARGEESFEMAIIEGVPETPPGTEARAAEPETPEAPTSTAEEAPLPEAIPSARAAA